MSLHNIALPLLFEEKRKTTFERHNYNDYHNHHSETDMFRPSLYYQYLLSFGYSGTNLNGDKYIGRLCCNSFRNREIMSALKVSIQISYSSTCRDRKMRTYIKHTVPIITII